MRFYFALIAIFTIIAANQKAFANENHNSLLKKSEFERTFVWDYYMKAQGYNCKVTEDHFMGLDYENAAYWSVDCNSSRIDGYVIRVPAGENAEATDIPCRLVEALLSVSCFKTLEKK